MNNRGDKTLPWGEQLETSFTLEMLLFTRTFWCLKQVRLLIIKSGTHIKVENSGMRLGFIKMTNQ